MLAQLQYTLLRTAICTLEPKSANRYWCAARTNSEGSTNCMPSPQLYAAPPQLQESCSRSETIMIQGRGPRRPSPKRHWTRGKLDVKELQLQQGECSLYTSSTLRRENRAQKHTNNPHVQGARTQDIQMMLGVQTIQQATKSTHHTP